MFVLPKKRLPNHQRGERQQKQGSGWVRKKRKGKKTSRGEATSIYNLATAARVYETLKQEDKRDAIVRTCEGSFAINATILVFFGVLWDDFEGGTVADGLTRLCSTDPPPPELSTFNANQQSVLIGLAALSPSLFLVQETSSSIASSQDTDGTLYSVELEHDATEELAAMRVALSAAWAVAKTRCGMDKEDFGAECPKLFNTDSIDFQTTFEFVVRQDNSEPQPRQDGATADSDFDTISKAATNAFAEWCKWKGTGAMERLFFKVLKLQ